MLGKTLAATLAFVISCAGGPVQAAEVKVLCASGMREIVSDLQPQLRQAASAEMSVSFGEAGDLRIQGGEIVDIAVLPRVVLDQVIKDGNVVPATALDIAQSSIGIGVRKDGPRPDISSPAKFKQVLLSAKTIVMTDPASGGVAGVHVADVFRRLEIISS